MGQPLERVVVVAKTRAAYQTCQGEDSIFGGKSVSTSADIALASLFGAWQLDSPRRGTEAWNPLSELIPAGSKVVIKPNWVFHENQSGAGLDCLITHHSVIEAIAKYVGLTHPAQLIIGDAPLQGCDFERLQRIAGIDAMTRRLRERGLPVSINDFRRTILKGNSLNRQRSDGIRDLKNFVLFDLGPESLLEGLNNDASRFRVTMYHPDGLRQTHAPGRHQYLIAKEVIEAGVVVNVPKLKSHKKACITGALKNLIGINGNKEYLPHHRKGGSASGGDCYSGQDPWKRIAEDLLDAANRRTPGKIQAAMTWMAGTAERIAVRLGAAENLEGSWYGYDTIWRTWLDLQRILRYGKVDGSMATTPQRTVISITDAIIGGEGEGPLANTPVESGFITGALNPAAAEWIHARLMGFDPKKIPLTRESFGRFDYPLADFSAESIRVRIGDSEQSADEIVPFEGRPFVPPRGWRGHCELDHPGVTPRADSEAPLVFAPPTEA